MTILAFKPRPKPPVIELPPTNHVPPSITTMVAKITQWAADMGVDVETTDFKYETATIMTVMQGMIHKVK